MTCHILLPAWKKDEAPYPRFDTSTTKDVYAGVYNGAKTGDQRIVNLFTKVGLKDAVTL